MINLRTRSAPRASAVAPSSGARVIAVTSGKGGVGKSVLSANIALSLASRGRRVLLIDADLSLANLDLILGVSARLSMRDILHGNASPEEVIIRCADRLWLLPACAGDESLTDLGPTREMAIFSAVDGLETKFDTVVVDTGAGIGSNARSFASAAQQAIVVVTPDPASISDAYAMLKVLSRRGVTKAYLAVNMATSADQAEQVIARLLNLVSRFLDLSVLPLGYVYRDEAVLRSVHACEPLLTKYPKSAVSTSLTALTDRILNETPDADNGRTMLFWKRLMGLSAPHEISEISI